MSPRLEPAATRAGYRGTGHHAAAAAPGRGRPVREASANRQAGAGKRAERHCAACLCRPSSGTEQCTQVAAIALRSTFTLPSGCARHGGGDHSILAGCLLLYI